MCDVPSHLQDHIYWGTESGRSQEVRAFLELCPPFAADSRRRQREQVGSSTVVEEPPQRCNREDDDVPSERSCSAQSSTTAPHVQLEEPDSTQEDQSRAFQDPVTYYVMSVSLWLSPNSPQSGGLPAPVFSSVVDTFMSWLTDSPYNPEM
ncbi:hypothetical protein Q5P01_014297 [Channa striata]|uniref:Uncharacterized protein n=1 Tax=Channa striata TaxID=64152 RepID=A0AA88MF55_CHASR|nr:hypothetical protein Q5P01_014297 [Channa striata]